MAYKDFYKQSGKSTTHDDVLNQITTWEVGNQGQVNKGGSFGPGGSFPNGTIFENCTLINFIKFGDGCIFVNCTFVRNPYQPWSKFGDGCVFDNCNTMNGVDIPQSAVLNKSTVGVGNNAALINNTLMKGKDLPAISHQSGSEGARIDPNHRVVTHETGIHGYSSTTPTTNKTEDKKPQI